MIDAADFLEAARHRGLTRYAGVPCSYLTPLIDRILADPGLQYVAAANEGDAVAVTAGLALGGGLGVTFMQNSGLGNAVSPLTSLTWTFRLPQLLIVSLRGEPGTADEPQHRLMGRITTDLLSLMEIGWEWFPETTGAIGPALDRALADMRLTRRPYALVLRGTSIAASSAAPPPEPARRATVAEPRRSRSRAPGTRAEALRRIRDLTSGPGTVVLATTGYTGRELYAVEDRPNQLYMVGSMGCVAGLALGLGMSRPDLRVVAIDGDGSLLMRLGLLTTVGAYGGDNILHIVLDNGRHESTGGQPTVSPGVSFAAIAAACGYGRAIEGAGSEAVDEVFAPATSDGPRLLHLRIAPGVAGSLPRPAETPEFVRDRFQLHLAGLS